MLATETTSFLKRVTETADSEHEPTAVKADDKWMSFVGRERSFYQSIVFIE
jgi:hypothetical protein